MGLNEKFKQSININAGILKLARQDVHTYMHVQMTISLLVFAFLRSLRVVFVRSNGKPIINFKKGRRLVQERTLYSISISTWDNNKLCYTKAIRKGNRADPYRITGRIQQFYLCDSDLI